MFKMTEIPAPSKRLAAGARAAILSIARHFDTLVSEHARALVAATKAASPRAGMTKLRAMYARRDGENIPDALTADWSAENRSAAIQGQLLRVSERREVAIYLRKDALWVADFIDGHGALVDAATWFRFNCGTPATTYARRRMVHESAVPLSTQLVARIEGLHRSVAVHTST